MRLVLMGPPGAGKGTQAERLAARQGALHLATGDLLRSAIRRGTPLGRQAQAIVERGDLVPDGVVLGMVAERLAEAFPPGRESRFVLDGFPRTTVQAEKLEELLASRAEPLTAVVALTVPEEELVRRLAGRLTCAACGRVFAAGSAGEACPVCGGALEVRPDDRPETVRRRLRVYQDQTAPVLEFYRARGLVREVSGVGTVEEVAERLLAALEPAARRPGS